jgi:ATP-dependent exoDNAse (exonuclease V) alpha subunit
MNTKKSKKASAEDAEGLEPENLLAEGARVMITRNLWTSKGLVNGAQGTVKKIWFSPGTDPHKDLPAVVFVACPDYSGTNILLIQIFPSILLMFLGPPTDGGEDIDPSWIPITPVTANWEDNGLPLSRTQFPLTLAWAITIHQSQGLTLQKAVIDLGAKDFAPGLSFVVISRVKSIDGIAFR